MLQRKWSRSLGPIDGATNYDWNGKVRSLFPRCRNWMAKDTRERHVCMKKWTAVIKQWAGLESIFLGSADIRAQLPDDTKRFEESTKSSKTYKSLLKWKLTWLMLNVDGRIDGLRNMLSSLSFASFE